MHPAARRGFLMPGEGFFLPPKGRSFDGGEKDLAAGNVYNPLGGLRRHFAERILDYGKVLKRINLSPVYR